jgi:stage II sporulation protein AA (anti-sigma F factor antagonist)
MECSAQDIADVMLVHISGRIDHANSQALADALMPQLDRGVKEHKKIVLDLGRVDFMSSGGLRALTIAARLCRRHACDIVVAALQPPVQEVFRIARFDVIFRLYGTVREALAEISPTASQAYDEG